MQIGFCLRSVGLLASAVLLSGCGRKDDDPPGLPPGSGSALRGQVFFGRERLPMSNVQVFASGPAELETVTDDAGNFAFEDIPAGSWLVSARVEYRESKTDQDWISNNHPGAKPGVTWTVEENGEDVVVDDTLFPNPVFLHSGLRDNIGSWDSMFPYLRQGSLTGIPGFITLRMPSIDDPYPGGYDNTGDALSEHDANGANFDRYINDFVNCEMTRWLYTELPRLEEDSYALALADTDADGDLDLVVGNDRVSFGADHPNRLHLNDGSGRFLDSTCAGLLPDPIGQGDTRALDLGDVDGDGDLDLVIGVRRGAGVGPGFDGRDRLYLNNGSGEFEEAVNQLPPDFLDTYAVVLADFDGDTDLDLFSGRNGQNGLYLNEAGDFTDATSRLPALQAETVRAIELDVEGDGDLDLVVSEILDAPPARSFLLENDGAGNFTESSLELPFARALATGDVDGDGDTDLVIGQAFGPDSLWINENGTLVEGTGRLPLRSGTTNAIAMADFDGDSDLDLVLGNEETNHMFLNDGQGNFTNALIGMLPSGASVGGDIASLAAGDFNGDGNIDIALGVIPARRNRLWVNEGGGVFRFDRQSVDQAKVDVIAHSMGGIITRAMLAGFGPGATFVERVICLDTPHGGSRPALVPGPTNFPALQEWRLNGAVDDCNDSDPLGPPDFEEGWNLAHLNVGSRDWLFYALPDDTIVVPNCSAKGYGRPSPVVFGSIAVDVLCDLAWNLFPQPAGSFSRFLKDTDDCHGDTACVFPTNGTKIHWNPERQFECAQWLASGILPSAVLDGTNSAKQTRCSLIDPVGTFSRSSPFVLASLEAQPASHASKRLQLASAVPIRGIVTLSGDDASFELFDANGRVVTTRSRSVGGALGGAQLHSFELDAHLATPVQLVLHGGSEGGSLGARFEFDEAPELAATVAHEGDGVRITARLVDAAQAVLEAERIWAVVEGPDRWSATIELLDDGQNEDGEARDGVFGARLPTQLSPGEYAVTLHAHRTEDVERSGLDRFIVYPTGASFASTLRESTRDEDGDGLFEELVFEQELLLERNGTFKVLGTLVNSAGQTIAFPGAVIENRSGGRTTTVALRVDGEQIARQGVDGPWLLRDLTIYDLECSSLPIARAPDQFSLSSRSDTFERPPAPQLTGCGSDSTSNAEITVFGRHLRETERVLVNGTEVHFTVTGDSTLRVRPVAGGASGTDLVVQTRWGTSRWPAPRIGAQ